jgi:hypothetical protein
MTLCKHKNGIYYIWWVDEYEERELEIFTPRRHQKARRPTPP